MRRPWRVAMWSARTSLFTGPSRCDPAPTFWNGCLFSVYRKILPIAIRGGKYRLFRSHALAPADGNPERRHLRQLPEKSHRQTAQSFVNTGETMIGRIVRAGGQKLSVGVAGLLLLLACGPASGQVSNGAILGTVKDPSGAAVPNAKLTVTNTDTNEIRNVTAAEDGSYRVPALRAGNYAVKVEAQGFKTVT